MRYSTETFCIVTVSSGIGMKLFAEGRPVVGPNGRGGEIGHVVVADGALANHCDCGGYGHLGAMASGRGVLETARRWADAGNLKDFTPHQLNERVIAQAFRTGEAWSTELIAESAVYLGRMLAWLHTAVGVEGIVIIGGFAVALGEPYRCLLVEAAERACWNLGVNIHPPVPL